MNIPPMNMRHPLPPGPPGPPMMGGVGGPPPPMPMPMPIVMPPHRGGGGGMGRSPFTNTVLITNIPSFFTGYQQVRDWLYPCGTAKSCLFYPRPPKRNNKKEGSGSGNGDPYDGEGGANNDSSRRVGGGDGDGSDANRTKKKAVLVNMLNPDQAMKVVASFRKFSDKLDDRYKGIRCCMVPSAPDVPLPPPLVDETAQTVLGEKLWHNFIGLETAHAEHEHEPGVGGSGGGSDKASRDAKHETGGGSNSNSNKKGEDDDTKPKLLDADKVAAAAGGAGAYDADEDPLNAPQVLEAVKAFRRKLDQTHGIQKTQRMELVAKKLGELRPRIRAQVDAETKNRREQQQQQLQLQRPGGALLPPPVVPLPAPPQASSLPQPPLPGVPPPLPPAALGLPPPPRGAVADSGKRGRSNLPAWMTQQQQQQQQAQGALSEDGPEAKKAKTPVSSYPSHFPSSLPPSSHPVLRQFLANQVKESMGEEEATLIDFLYTHILQGKGTSELFQELQVVLEEEADGFLKAVWAKVQEIQPQN
eukprot:jgi/Psemu1/284644/fgenesh1_pg.59_\